MTPASPNMGAAPDRWVARWLFTVSVFVLAMIVVGGATRLTDSGLSITEWDLGKGVTPPLSAERWAEEFALYQRTAEYRMQNRGMSLAEFQSIYWWEWGHRFLGKVIGLVFAAPFFMFWAQGRLQGRFWPVLGLFTLGGLQGAIGWWMVTSGLWNGLDVSPMRLAVHLGMAFTILGVALWLALDASQRPVGESHLGAPRWVPFALIGLVLTQVLMGALFAGADAGPAYSDWPTIGGQWIPGSAFELEPLWRNLTSNHAAQHLVHRSLGYAVAIAALAVGALAWLRGRGPVKRWALVASCLALVQAALGVLAVMTGAHLHVSLTHQFTAALLWCAVIIMAHRAAIQYRHCNYRKKNDNIETLDVAKGDI